MTPSHRTLLVNRIIAGHIRCKINGATLLYKHNTPTDKYLAEEEYMAVLGEAEMDGALNEEELEQTLRENGIWGPVKEAKLKQCMKNIDDLKFQLYQSLLKPGTQKELRIALDETRSLVSTLHNTKHSLDYLSAMGAATIVKLRFLAGMAIYDIAGNQLYDYNSYWSDDTSIVDTVLTYISTLRIEESQYRELVRNEPWRSISYTGQHTTLFSCINDEQKMLLYWSKVYQNVYEHPEAPPEDVINDDDILDGWFIAQRRKREKETDKDYVESKLTNEKIKSSSEVFVVADAEGRKRVDNANTEAAIIKRKQRMAYLEKKGTLDEAEMPDTKLEIMTARNRAATAKMKG